MTTGDQVVAGMIGVAVVWGALGGTTIDVAKDRLKYFPINQQVRVFLLWPLYWVFRILAGVFWAPEQALEESYRPPAIMPD